MHFDQSVLLFYSHKRLIGEQKQALPDHGSSDRQRATDSNSDQTNPVFSRVDEDSLGCQPISAHLGGKGVTYARPFPK